MTYSWKENPACVATYRILEGDNFLDQFEDADVSFDDAADLELGKLRYYPTITANQNIIEILAMEIARKFLNYLVKTYTVYKEDAADTKAEILKAVADVFEDKSKTIKDLAEVVDEKIRFPGEAEA